MKRERARGSFDSWEMTKFLYTQELAEKRYWAWASFEGGFWSN